MKSSDTNSGDDLAAEERHVDVVKNENETLKGIEYMPTLPSVFKSLVGRAVKIETEEPQYVIELLGDLLGVTDYKTNKAAFWFLDTIALQVLRYKDKLDDYYRGVLISWLAGEMKLIRDKKLSREDFFKEMKVLFLYVAEALPDGNRLLHWDLLVDKYVEIIPKGPNSENSQSNICTITNAIDESSSLISPSGALDVIIEATYNMYANELRYALVYAVFVTPIYIQTYHMSHTLQIPRQIKLADTKTDPFDVQLREQLEKIAKSETTMSNRIGKKNKVKNKTNVKEEQTLEDLNMELPPTPRPSLTEEEILANNQFILPLLESKETARIFETHAENM